MKKALLIIALGLGGLQLNAQTHATTTATTPATKAEAGQPAVRPTTTTPATNVKPAAVATSTAVEPKQRMTTKSSNIEFRKEEPVATPPKK